MDTAKVRRVVIAGGGTAGWIAAAALVKQLGPLLDITLVESEDIGTVGVGESTIPTSRTFHNFLGIDEQAFMRATQASFKLGISFENWGRAGERYIHSFGTIGRKTTWMGDFHHLWLHARDRGFAGSLGEYCFELKAADAGRFATASDAQINYAYHLDAGRYARFLRELSEPAGVRRVEGKIERVEQHGETGDVEGLVLESGVRIEGDLFLDCTGFRGLLIEQTLQSGYEDWTQWLPTDSAIAVQTASVGPAVPYTRAIAHEAGWRWRIPLQHRVGNGIVYAQDCLSDDEARAKLLAGIEGEVLTEPRVIRYRTGARRKVWNKNVVALGLSSGFVEPLESTSIHLMKIAVTRLIQLFPFDGINDALTARFNAMSHREAEGVRDFIILHYHLNQRDEPLWRRCREMQIPDTLAERIALFREDAQAYQASEDLFRVDSWVQVLLGQNLQPGGYHRMGQMISDANLKRALGDIRGDVENRVAKLPAHQDFLDRYCSAR
ncbi:MAG: tryptophan 7-halogenase [Sphingomonas sp.]|nr:MAG: tryptophan 7-halogenase [Sphingomonas sp.]